MHGVKAWTCKQVCLIFPENFTGSEIANIDGCPQGEADLCRYANAREVCGPFF